MPSAELTRLIDRIVAGDVDTVKTILRAHPSLVNDRDGNGATPLRGDADWLVRFVTRHPALLTAVSSNGKTVAQHAAESGNADIARIFSTSSHI